MKGRVRWSRLIIALGVIAAVVIAAPAVGGSSATTAVTVSKKSLKNLVKKEVAKQIAKATGPAGPPGSAGQPGSAAAYGLIEGGGTVDDASSLNLTDGNVTNPSPGVYCIGGLPFQPRNAVATPEAASVLDSRDRIAAVLLSDSGSTPFGCAAGDRIRVQIIDLGVLGATAAGFTDNYVWIWIED